MNDSIWRKSDSPNEICLHRWCVYCLRKAFFIFNNTCCGHITSRDVFDFPLMYCMVKFSNWFKKYLLDSWYRSSRLPLCCYTSSKCLFCLFRGTLVSSMCIVQRYDVGHVEFSRTFFMTLNSSLASSIASLLFPLSYCPMHGAYWFVASTV